MFDRKDAVPALFLLLLIFAIVVTLSQILVVHHHNHHNSRHPKNSKSVQSMLNQLEKTVHKVMKSNVLSQKKYEHSLLAQIYAARVRKTLEMIQKKEHRKDSKRQYIMEKEHKARVLQTSKGKVRNIVSEDYTVNSKSNSDEIVYAFDGEVNKSKAAVNNQRRFMFSEQDLENKQSRTGKVLSRGLNFQGRQHQAMDTKSTGKRSRIHSSESIDTMQKRKLRPIQPPKEMCPEFPEHLLGPLEVSMDIPKNAGEAEAIPDSDVGPGGRWRPQDCVARHRVAIVVPYRDRQEHLDTLLYHLLPILQRQQLDFRIFVVEQAGNDTFNKGRLMNAGFTEAWKMEDFNCFIFHDVDLIPEDDRNMYSCPPGTTRHMSVAVDKFNYTLPYQRLVGGVFSISREHFLKVNGYSNLYWGWGAEDDDMALRLKEVGFGISRPPPKVARYKMIKHDTRETLPYQWTYYMLRTLRKRYKKDGLNSLNYKVVSIDNKPTFTHVMVNVGDAPKKRVFL